MSFLAARSIFFIHDVFHYGLKIIVNAQYAKQKSIDRFLFIILMLEEKRREIFLFLKKNKKL
jgi:hypothetical protein